MLTLSLMCPLVLASVFVRQQAFCFPLGYFQYFQKKLSILRRATGTQQQQEVGIQQRNPEGRQADRRQGPLTHLLPPMYTDLYGLEKTSFRHPRFSLDSMQNTANDSVTPT